MKTLYRLYTHKTIEIRNKQTATSIAAIHKVIMIKNAYLHWKMMFESKLLKRQEVELIKFYHDDLLKFRILMSE